MTSRRVLLLVGTSGATCQLARPRFVTDSRMNPVDGNGQEKVRVLLLRTTARPGPAETQVFNSTETPPAINALATARSGLTSPLKSPSAAELDEVTAA